MFTPFRRPTRVRSDRRELRPAIDVLEGRELTAGLGLASFGDKVSILLPALKPVGSDKVSILLPALKPIVIPTVPRF